MSWSNASRGNACSSILLIALRAVDENTVPELMNKRRGMTVADISKVSHPQMYGVNTSAYLSLSYDLTSVRYDGKSSHRLSWSIISNKSYPSESA